MKPMDRVVSGLMLHKQDGRLLMGRRKSFKKRGDLWELPGGKVETNEDPRDALHREWEEELGVDVFVEEFIASATLELESSFVIELYHVTMTPQSGPLRALDHADLSFVPPWDAVQRLPCSPAFYLHWPWIRRFLELGPPP